VRWIKKAFPGHPSREEMTNDEVLGDLRGCGVDLFFNMVFPLRESETEPLNEFSVEIGKRYDRVVPFGSMHVETARKDEVAERCLVEQDLAGIKLHPYVQGFEAFSPEFEPMYRKLGELGRPFIVHTGFDSFYRQVQDLDYLRGILESHPEMPVVLVHSLFPRFGLAHELMSGHPQLYLDMTNVISAVRWYLEAPPGAWAEFYDERDALNEGIEHFHRILEDFSDRVMFGTDHPAGMGSPEQIYADFDSFGFPPEVSGNLLGGTARRFLVECCGR
jgi:predicted TIM-barrel fold metal-dependent hydrolase